MEVAKHLSNKSVKGWLADGDYASLKKAFYEVCRLMNPRNSVKRQKWNALAEEYNIQRYPKGYGLYCKLKAES